MKKIVIVMLTVILLTGCVNKQMKWEETSDSIKFKEEYEALNDKVKPNGTKHLKVSIPSKNPFEYLNLEETIKLLESGTGIIYFGRPGCPYCRSTIETLIEFAKEGHIETIYYFNPEKDREEFTEGYQKILSILDEYMKVDTVNQKESDEDFDPKLKRMSVPDLFFINKGRVIGHYNEDRAGFTTKLNKKQKDEIKDIYKKIHSDYQDSLSVCTEEC